MLLIAGASRIWKFVKSNVLRVYILCDVTLLGLFYDFPQQSSTFRRDLVLQLLNPYHTISAVTALQADAELEVACPILSVLRDEHLSIDRPVCSFFSPGLL